MPWNLQSRTLLQSVHENRIYSLSITCDASYPDHPPVITFLTRINLPCVNPSNGKVCSSLLPTPSPIA